MSHLDPSSQAENHSSPFASAAEPKRIDRSAGAFPLVPTSASPAEHPAPPEKADSSSDSQLAIAKVLGHWADGPARASDRDPPLAKPASDLLTEAAYHGTGIALPYRSQLERELGVGLAGVRAQVGRHEAMDRLGAAAFASGNLVAFRDATPPYEQVREEVIHTLQQGRGQGQGISHPSSAAETEARAGRNLGTGRDAAIHRQELLQPPVLAKGVSYKLTKEDVDERLFGSSVRWHDVARNHGLLEEELTAFNQKAKGEVGEVIYIPSAEEQAWRQCEMKTTGNLAESLPLFQELRKTGGLDILTAARSRASGTVGMSYGTEGIAGKAGPNRFLSPNPNLAGASQANCRELDGRTEHEVMWQENFFKCNVFMEDSIYQAGYKPAMHGQDGQKHYASAGTVDKYPDRFQELTVAEVGPGTVVQFDGGDNSDQSHNAILSSFIQRQKASFWSSEYSESKETWTMTIIGAEEDRAAASKREVEVEIKGSIYTSVTNGKIIRFFRPTSKR